MKRTGPTREKAKIVIALLEKASRKSKSAIWLDLAQRLAKPRRQRAMINLWKLDRLSVVFPRKSLVVPGKVLGNGAVSGKLSVVAFEFSAEAKRKINEAGGKALGFEEALKQKLEPKSMVIVK